MVKIYFLSYFSLQDFYIEEGRTITTSSVIHETEQTKQTPNCTPKAGEDHIHEPTIYFDIKRNRIIKTNYLLDEK